MTPNPTEGTEILQQNLKKQRRKEDRKRPSIILLSHKKKTEELADKSQCVRQHKPVKLQHNKLKLSTNRERQKESWKNDGKQELGSRVCLTLTEVSLSDEISYSSAVEEGIVFHGLTLHRSRPLGSY